MKNKQSGGSGVDLGLSLTGMRIGPRDPTTHTAKVGIKNEVVRPDHTLGSLQPRILKERTGFSGGFKIPEDFRKSKMTKKNLLHDNDKEDDFEGTQQSQITKDEIFQQLNLGHSEAGIGIGRHGTNSKTALAKDLVEGIEKDLEKLRRQQENLQLRKTLALNGGQSIVEETQEEKDRELQQKLKHELESVGAFVIDAQPKKFQVMRHQASQLTSTKNLDLEELERMRFENEKRLKELEEVYMRKKENSTVGKIMRERMGFSTNKSQSNSPKNQKELDFDRDQDDDLNLEDDKLTKSQKRKKVRIVDEKENLNADLPIKKDVAKSNEKLLSRGRNAVPTGISLNSFGDQKRSSLSGKRKKTESPIQYDSPRRKLYEAKFEKYLANKQQKVKQEKKLEKMAKEDFDRYTKGPDSPAKSSMRFLQSSANKNPFDPDSLIPKDYDEKLMISKKLEEEKRLQSLKKDKFKSLGVSNEDKMTFFLLKWIFNAIKRDSSSEDPKLFGKPYVTKIDLINQLAKNDELIRALGYNDSREVAQAVKISNSVKEGSLLWEEFLDFFFLRQTSLQKRYDSGSDNWWRKIGNSETKDDNQVISGRTLSHSESEQQRLQEAEKAKSNGVPSYGRNQQAGVTISSLKYQDPDKKPFKMTESLKLLQETRQNKTAAEVEDEFKALQEQKKQQQQQQAQNQNSARKAGKQHQQQRGNSKNKMVYEYEGFDEDDEQLMELGLQREKSECLLLHSQIYIMQEIYEAMDKYNDKILRRADYIMALRTDERVVEFIDVEAVRVPYSKKVLNLDQVLEEVEKDELYELAQVTKNAGNINHKEFITWREFMSYFNDYREIEDRNKKSKEIQRTRENIQKERKAGQLNNDDNDKGVEIASLIEKEKIRRLQELPKLRPADQIDISEKQLQLLRDIYDQLPRAQQTGERGSNGGSGGKDAINTIDFFIATRKNPQLRAISSAIARDPEGYSRIPRETFQQVFDRMENEIQSKQLEWATIVEYFTKRGRPMTKEEVNKIIEDDRRQREDEDARRKSEEEAERRRMARLMEDLEDKEDFEEFEIRQKSEEAAKIKQDQLFERQLSGQFKENEEENEFDRNRFGHGEDDEAQEERRRGRGRHRFMDESDDDYDDEDNIDRDDDDNQDGGYTSDPELRTAKRSIKFADDNKRTRAKSAHRGGSKQFNDEKGIRSTKLTTRDYIQNHMDRSLSRKKGKYGVTVPRPFTFDIRDKTRRSKSIRERRVEAMVAEKKVQEENILKHQFRSNPIPPEVLIPRYKSIMEANEMRRLEVKQNSMVLTKQKEKPFSFYERDKNKKNLDQEEYLPDDLKKKSFKANPIPRACSVLIFDQMMKKQEEERQERIRKQAELNFSKAKLPDRMQMHQEKMRQEQQNQSKKSIQEELGYSFKPKINDLVTREQFEKAQQKFNQKLNKKKASQQVTRPRSPNFTKTSSKTLERQYLNENQPAPIDKFKQALHRNLTKSIQEKAAGENPSSTVAMNLAMQKRREELEAKRQVEEAKRKEEEERKARQNRMKNTVQSALRDRIKDDTQKRDEEKEKRARDAREAKKEAERKLKEMNERVRGQPLLVERLHLGGKSNSNLAKIKATQAFLDILKTNGVDPKDHLTDEQKELLAEEEYKKEFIEKKRSGRL